MARWNRGIFDRLSMPSPFLKEIERRCTGPPLYEQLTIRTCPGTRGPEDSDANFVHTMDRDGRDAMKRNVKVR